MITLRDYQIENAAKGLAILKRLNIVYLCLDMQTGKTLTSLSIAKDYGAKNVLFLTIKKVIPAIIEQYEKLNPGYKLTVINDESMHKVAEYDFDLVIHDEHHRFGALRKPGVHTKTFKKLFGHLPHIYLSGTPAPENYSQIYHQFWVSKFTPFTQTTFYKWAKDFVNITTKRLPHGEVNDYSDARLDLIAPIIDRYMVKMTSEEAGFKTEIKEEIIWVEPSPKIKKLCDLIVKDRVILGQKYNITADSPVALRLKLWQLWSGTIKFDPTETEPEPRMTLDTVKAETILRRFQGQKLVIFYKFKQELEVLLATLGDIVTTDIPTFRSTNKSLALQIKSGREGNNFTEADAVVFYNIDDAYLSYAQAIARLRTIDRLSYTVYWLFTKSGIEQKIYHAVTNKKDYTINMFKADFGINHTVRHYQKV